MIVVVRAVKLVGFDGELLVALQLVGSDGEVLLFIGKDVEIDGVGRRRRKIDALEMGAGIERRIEQFVERRGLELDGGTRFRSRGERGRVLPPFRQLEHGVDLDVAREVSGRIHRDFIPFEIGDVVGDLDAAFGRAQRREIVEIDIHRTRGGRQRHMEGVHIDWSRIHWTRVPSTLVTMPASREMGPVGEWFPGIHCG